MLSLLKIKFHKYKGETKLMTDFMVEILTEHSLKKLLKKDREKALEIYFEKSLAVNQIIQE